MQKYYDNFIIISQQSEDYAAPLSYQLTFLYLGFVSPYLCLLSVCFVFLDVKFKLLAYMSYTFFLELYMDLISHVIRYIGCDSILLGTQPSQLCALFA